MNQDSKEDAERRDAVLRRMLATPKPSKDQGKDGKPKRSSTPPIRPLKGKPKS